MWEAMWVDVTDKDTGEGGSGLTARLAPYATASDRSPRMVFKPKGLLCKSLTCIRWAGSFCSCRRFLVASLRSRVSLGVSCTLIAVHSVQILAPCGGTTHGIIPYSHQGSYSSRPYSREAHGEDKKPRLRLASRAL